MLGLNVIPVIIYFQVELPTDISCSTDLISHLKSKSVPAEELLTFAGLSAPLRWGEVVPLWYLAQALADQGAVM